MHTGVAYAVVTTHPDQGTMDRYVQWLLHEHAAQVIASGARSAEVIRVAPDGQGQANRFKAMIVYKFSDVTAYERYISEHAPRLRAEGKAFLETLPGAAQIGFERWWGEVVGGL